MTALLRHPASVPSLFSPAPEAERPRRGWALVPRLSEARLFALAWGCGAAMLIDVPLIRNAGAAAARLIAS